MRQAPQHGVQMPPPPRTPLGSVLRLGAGRGKVGWSSARPRAVPSSCCSLPLIGPTGRTRRLAVLTGNPRGGGGLSGTPGSRGLPVSTAPGNRLATRCPPKRQLPPTRCPQQSPAGGPLGRVASPRPVLLADDLRSREGGAAASGMLDSSVADAMTQLTLKLLEKKLEQEREHVGGDPEDPRVTPGGEDRPDAALLGALGRRRDLLRTLREQRLLEEASQAPARSRPPPPATPPLGVYPAAPLPPRAPEPPWLIQPWALQPLAAAVQPPPQAGPPPRGPGGIKEDMVEMMLMQNAQLHQILMHSLMLRALPSSVFSPLGASQAAPLHPGLQRPRAPSVHHHHHYAPPAPGSLPACPPWPALLATLPPAPGLLPALHPLAGPAAAGSPPASDGALPTQAAGPWAWARGLCQSAPRSAPAPREQTAVAAKRAPRRCSPRAPGAGSPRRTASSRQGPWCCCRRRYVGGPGVRAQLAWCAPTACSRDALGPAQLA
ncbi:uncharacterized protein C21orf58 homolog isoform X1 [Canis lupus familiaris]|uniref:uncharacterized protein C21orf58 homolog isoform X1 n=1 Tax=Canis lupus familiaris TaxID=9615 RepID=UPI0015F19DE1|nr:uncharacterized protein C21orf58 homolog isoform X1 [Canis lupus familiaris]